MGGWSRPRLGVSTGEAGMRKTEAGGEQMGRKHEEMINQLGAKRGGKDKWQKLTLGQTGKATAELKGK